MTDNNNKVIIYTDGAARGNPGPGGYAAILIYGNYRKEISQGYRLTTNNRMELMAVIAALEALKKEGLNIEIYSDSQYVVDAIEKKWIFEWEKKRFKGKKNSDLWLRFLKLYRLHNIKFNWIRGHNHNSENERCDYLAVKASYSDNLLIDEGYENNKDENENLIF